MEPVCCLLLPSRNWTACESVLMCSSTGHDVKGLRTAFADRIPGNLVLQDRPEILAHASLDAPDEKVAHDFLTEQPVKGTSPSTTSPSPPPLTLLPRSPRLLPPQHHPRLVRQRQQHHPLLPRPRSKTQLLQDPHQRLRSPRLRGALEPDRAGLGTDGVVGGATPHGEGASRVVRRGGVEGGGHLAASEESGCCD